MHYTIYIAIVVLAILFFVIQGLNRKKRKDRKSRRFMEGYRQEDRNKTKEDRGN